MQNRDHSMRIVACGANSWCAYGFAPGVAPAHGETAGSGEAGTVFLAARLPAVTKMSARLIDSAQSRAAAISPPGDCKAA